MISVIIPAYNEEGNVAVLFERDSYFDGLLLQNQLQRGFGWEE